MTDVSSCLTRVLSSNPKYSVLKKISLTMQMVPSKEEEKYLTCVYEYVQIYMTYNIKNMHDIYCFDYESTTLHF